MITLIKGNCLESLYRLSPKSIDMGLFDLPFATTKNKWESKIPLNDLWYRLCPVMKDNAALAMFSKQPFSGLLTTSYFMYKHQWIWDKHESGNFAVAKHQPLAIHEEINVFGMSGAKINYYPQMVTGKMRKKGGKASTKNGRGFGGLKNITVENDQYHPKSILNFPSVPRVHRLHSAEKPIDLLSYLIRTYSKENETILDVTFGSCSSGIAALETGRNYIGIELDDEYYDIGVKRVECWIEEHDSTAFLQLA